MLQNTRRTASWAGLVLLAAPLTGCIGLGSTDAAGVDTLSSTGFSIATFVQDLEKRTGEGLVAAKVETLSIEFNQTRVTLVDWRSFTPNDGQCDLVSTMVYEGVGDRGGFLVHNTGEPCPLSLAGTPSVAEVVALVDRVSLPLLQSTVVGGAPLFSTALAGYCGYREDPNATTKVHIWNGRGLTATKGTVHCDRGINSALALEVYVPNVLSGERGPASYVFLEHVPSR